MGDPGRRERIGLVVGGVLRQALADAGATVLLLSDHATPEGRLAWEWAVGALGGAGVQPAEAGGPGLGAHPANKTVLLIAPVAAPVLPLGDLYASEVEDLAGAWSGPRELTELAEAAGGIARLDAALRAWLEDGQSPGVAFGPLGHALAERLMTRLEHNRSARWRPGLVPKLGSRTLGVDLYE